MLGVTFIILNFVYIELKSIFSTEKIRNIRIFKPLSSFHCARSRSRMLSFTISSVGSLPLPCMSYRLRSCKVISKCVPISNEELGLSPHFCNELTQLERSLLWSKILWLSPYLSEPNSTFRCLANFSKKSLP